MKQKGLGFFHIVFLSICLTVGCVGGGDGDSDSNYIPDGAIHETLE